MTQRAARVIRRTNDTDITVDLNIDGHGLSTAHTGVGFFDHMLSQLARNSMFDISVVGTGDLHVDAHHVVEDTAITLGQAFVKALSDKRGITRYGAALVPLDEALVQAAVDLSGRPYAVYRMTPRDVPAMSGYESSLTPHAIESFAFHSQTSLHVHVLQARDPHHAHEAVFKALGLALRQACSYDRRADGIVPSTKGVL
ncbi:imidazoleglycerol-phosphate dehydratase HisB [Micromonospora tulbaghiae]|uniref:imidazoleglycerol-phosphate dehydratase HisB n=1 Tax=Micromonospora tulbaghiae TaxID=479978 RepID=UPI0033C84B39